MTPLLVARGLADRRQGRTLFHDLDLDLKVGELHCFVGGQGSGKSSLMQLLGGCRRPTAGRIEVFGHDLAGQSWEAKRRIGYLPQDSPSHPKQSVADYLNFLAAAYGIRPATWRKRRRELVEELELEALMARRLGSLSPYEGRLIGLAAALFYTSPILLLDEPLAGLLPHEAADIVRRLETLRPSKAMLIATRDAAPFASLNPRILALEAAA